MSNAEQTPVQGQIVAVDAAINAAMLAELTQLRAQNAALIAAKGKISIPGTTTEKGNFTLGEGCYAKVSEKGAISIYGFGKWPVTLYKDQLFRLAKVMSLVLQFAKDNDAKLRAKPAPVEIVK